MKLIARKKISLLLVIFIVGAFFNLNIGQDVSKPKLESGNFINDKLKYEQFLTDALILQSQSDSLLWIVKDLKAKIEIEDDYQKKQLLIANFSTLSKESERLQMLADEKFIMAEQQISTIDIYNQQSENPNIQIEANINGITLYSYTIASNHHDTFSETNDNIEYEKSKGSVKIAQSGFSIQQACPYSANHPIPIVTKSTGLIYRIQLGSYSHAIPENTFKGLRPVSKELGDYITKYYVGSFLSLKEVRKGMEQVKNYGYPDVFIVAYNNNKKISIQNAKEIEFVKR